MSHNSISFNFKSLFNTSKKKFSTATALFTSGVLIVGMIPLLSSNSLAKAQDVPQLEIPATSPVEPSAVPGEYIISYEKNIKTLDEDIMVVHQNENATILPALASIETTSLDELGVKEQEIISDTEGFEFTKIVVDENTNEEDVIEALKKSPEIKSVEPNALFQLFDTTSQVRPVTVENEDRKWDDPFSITSTATGTPNQNYIYNTHIADIWNQGVKCQSYDGESYVQIAVIDSIPRIDHEDFFISSTKKKFDLTYARDFTTGVNGGSALTKAQIDAIDWSTTANRGVGGTHSTLVSGVLSAQADNGIGIAGTSYNADLIPIAVTKGGETTFSMQRLIDALSYIKTKVDAGLLPKLRVINMSLGAPGGPFPTLETLVNYLYSKNILCVAAAGNDGTQTENYPACLDNVIGVMATSKDAYSKADFSNYNTKMNISAPGSDIITTIPWSSNWSSSTYGRYGAASGTSFATPIVSGMAAALFSLGAAPEFVPGDDPNTPRPYEYKGNTAKQIRDAIVKGSIDISNVDSRCKPFIDAERSLYILSNDLTDANNISYPRDISTAAEKAAFDSHSHTTDAAHTTELSTPTCTTTGQIKKTCTYAGCNYNWIDNIDALGHNWKNNAPVAPTCTTAGRNSRTCSRCSEVDNTEIPALGHNYTGGITWTWATDYTTCDVNYVCQRNAAHSGTTRASISSNVSGSTITYNATAVIDGQTYTDSRNTTATHSHEPGATQTTPATCEQDGQKIIHCTKCDASWVEKINALGHNWVLQTSTGATCTDPGSKTFKCSNCGNTKQEPISSVGHNWSVVWTWTTTNTSASAKVKFTCLNNNAHTATKDATIEKVSETTTDIKYKATVVYNEITYSENKTVNKVGTDPATPVIPIEPGKKTIENGTYTLVSGLSSSKVIDINAASKLNKANAHLWSNNDTDAQVFNVQYDVNKNTYTIVNINSGLALGVDGDAKNGTNVCQLTVNKESQAQQWYIVKQLDGTYIVCSALDSSFTLDVNAASTINGTNIHLWKSNGTKAQRWVFKSTVSNAISGKTITNGTYEIVSKISSSKVIDVNAASKRDGANVQLWTANGTDAQKFIITYDGTGFYTIKNKASGKCLDVASASPFIGANIWQWTNNNTDAQKWRIRINPDGSYTITSKASGHALDVNAGLNINGANIHQWSVNGTNAQKWTFKKTF